ncbi:hypothetical protein EMIHUDRAFT_431722 [Emiliania huxleyi CCMP1516]|uniref:Uncharacterized protein n=2 Tax=Emiliania huxleyi TaxID=2903 RepID=A0A0D3L0S3_EMIH1|nr:hypothetical protein EMIHUDRAFT_431722 [Emiliania huxleyi CCMP1516]EOD41608.1 hypothetical protein EMIHUDRAFT_431722 [Emiliania huxleyi CCMP1516]|eukprot:XP_005794037.1 hypothetical protein EMIHUDRAFT_431722 [Emiliania huxleyi CCMP1516]
MLLLHTVDGSRVRRSPALPRRQNGSSASSHRVLQGGPMADAFGDKAQTRWQTPSRRHYGSSLRCPSRCRNRAGSRTTRTNTTTTCSTRVKTVTRGTKRLGSTPPPRRSTSLFAVCCPREAARSRNTNSPTTRRHSPRRWSRFGASRSPPTSRDGPLAPPPREEGCPRGRNQKKGSRSRRAEAKMRRTKEARAFVLREVERERSVL